MYIGPWQEFRLAKMHKEAVTALKTLSKDILPAIRGSRRNMNGRDETLALLQTLQNSMSSSSSSKHPSFPSLVTGDESPEEPTSARSSSSMPSIHAHKKQDDGAESINTSRSAPGLSPSHLSSLADLMSESLSSKQSRYVGKKPKKRKKIMSKIEKRMSKINKRKQLYTKRGKTDKKKPRKKKKESLRLNSSKSDSVAIRRHERREKPAYLLRPGKDQRNFRVRDDIRINEEKFHDISRNHDRQQARQNIISNSTNPRGGRKLLQDALQYARDGSDAEMELNNLNDIKMERAHTQDTRLENVFISDDDVIEEDLPDGESIVDEIEVDGLLNWANDLTIQGDSDLSITEDEGI